MNPDRHEIEPHTSATVGAREETPLARRWEPLGPIWRQHPRNANPDENAGPAPGAHAPHSPASASDAQPNARQRPPPAAPPRGGRHRGGVGTPLEGTYFQAKLGNAMCVQSLDDSLNSAIHITYRISLRSSSLREPRYPSTGVVVRFVWKARASLYTYINRPARAVGWGGASQRQRRRHAPERRARDIYSHARPHAHAPPTRATQAREAARRGRHEDDRRPLRGAGARSHGVRNGYR